MEPQWNAAIKEQALQGFTKLGKPNALQQYLSLSKTQ